MLSEEFLRRLDALSLTLMDAARGAVRRREAVAASGHQRGVLSDFREYAPGDDIRRIDWNAYARFDRLFLKLFTEERETILTVVLDASRSMAQDGKWETAVMAAEALVYLTLSGGRPGADRTPVGKAQRERRLVGPGRLFPAPRLSSGTPRRKASCY